MKNLTVVGTGSYDHMPEPAVYQNLTGLTLEQALKVLRSESWGNIGELSQTDLSDGTFLEVNLTPASDGNSRYINSQRVERFKYIDGFPKTLRRYYI